MKYDMENCKSCKHLDKKLSTDTMIVCKYIPLSVVMCGSSKDCENFKKLKTAEVREG